MFKNKNLVIIFLIILIFFIIFNSYSEKFVYTTDIENIDVILDFIHRNLKLKYGSFEEGIPIQIMAVTYLSGNEKVLEIGRNSLIIGHILSTKNNNFVVLESDTTIYNQLIENRDLNNMNFYIENSSLSKRKLIQKNNDTIESDVYKPINIISWNELLNKYNIKFDTLVLDCEDEIYYILIDMPEILDNIKLIIMKNDYHEIERKNYVDSILIKNNFYLDYVKGGGWGSCYDKFFEVWLKK
jgi:hypothetical protein